MYKGSHTRGVMTQGQVPVTCCSDKIMCFHTQVTCSRDVQQGHEQQRESHIACTKHVLNVGSTHDPWQHVTVTCPGVMTPSCARTLKLDDNITNYNQENTLAKRCVNHSPKKKQFHTYFSGLPLITFSKNFKL